MRFSRAITLIELLVAIIVLVLVMFGIYSIQIFSEHQVVSSNRKAMLQNELTVILEHMTKHIARAASDGATYPVDFGPSGHTVRIWTDSNGDGALNRTSDRLIMYCTTPGSFLLNWCDDVDPTGYVYDGGAATNCKTGHIEDLGTHITTILNSGNVTRDINSNFLTVNLTACYDPQESEESCGSLNNPKVTMSTRILMPAVCPD